MAERRPVCVQRVGFLTLLVLRVVSGRPSVVLYDTWPRYGKALVKWFRVPEPWLETLLSLAVGSRVRRAAPPSASRGSPALNVEGMKVVTRMMLGLSPLIERDGWVKALSQGIGEEPAVAYFHRRFPWHDVWPQVLCVTLSLSALEGTKPLAVWNPHWPESWERVAETSLREAFGVDLFVWPLWYRRVARASSNAYWAGRVAFSACLLAFIRRRRGSRTVVPVAIEMIESGRLGGGPFDTNYVEDGRLIRREDVVYFFTKEQSRTLRKSGIDPSAELSTARRAGFNVADLRRAPLDAESRATLRRLATTILARRRMRGAGCLGFTYCRAWNDVRSWLGLFSAYRPANVLHTQNPNGCAGGRFDSAVLTGLCRMLGMRSVGYQNRTTYDTVCEDCFDCYDSYLAWGERWRTILGAGNRFTGQLVPVGCIDNEGRPATSSLSNAPAHVVTIFTTELEGNLFAHLGVIELLRACVQLARDNPSCRFRVKMKDPHHVDTVLADSEMRSAFESVARNVEFLRLKRHNVASAIAESDIVVASAWTTPGSDALLMEKRVLFFNSMGGGGAPFEELPDMIASSPGDLSHLFRIALNDYATYSQRHAAALSKLDPFRDGRPRERIIAHLLAPTV